MDELILCDYQRKYDVLKQEFLENNMPSLFLKLEKILSKPHQTKEDKVQYVTIYNKIVEWNEKVKTLDMTYLSLPEYHPYIQNPTLFYLDIKNE